MKKKVWLLFVVLACPSCLRGERITGLRGEWRRDHPERKAPPSRVARRAFGGRRRAAGPPTLGRNFDALGRQLVLSFCNTSSLSLPVTGRWFCFWYSRKAWRVAGFIWPVILPLYRPALARPLCAS